MPCASTIRSSRDKDTERIYYGRAPKKLPNQPKFVERAQSKLKILNRSPGVSSLRIPPGNRLEQLEDDPEGQRAIAINMQWRICFVFDEGAGDALEVEITDHQEKRDEGDGCKDFGRGSPEEYTRQYIPVG